MTPDRNLIVLLPDAMHKALRVRAAELGESMSAIVRELIQAWLDGQIELAVEEDKEK